MSNLDEAKGRAKQAAGDLSGDRDMQREGEADERAGKAKEKLGQLEDKAEEVVDAAKDKLG